MAFSPHIFRNRGEAYSSGSLIQNIGSPLGGQLPSPKIEKHVGSVWDFYIFDFEDDCTFQDIEPLELHRRIVPRLQLESTMPYARKTSLHPKLRVRFDIIDRESLVSQVVEEVVDRFVH